MRRTAGLLACLTLLTLVPPAGAAEKVPPPTVSISVTANGVALPTKLSSASWVTEGAPGDNADLEATLVNPPGAVTTMEALWTTRTLRAYNGFPLLYHWISASHAGVATATMPATFDYGYRLRPAGGRWGPWRTTAVSHDAGGGLSLYDDKDPVVLGKVPAPRVQLQFRVRVELVAAGRETQSYKLQAS